MMKIILRTLKVLIVSGLIFLAFGPSNVSAQSADTSPDTLLGQHVQDTLPPASSFHRNIKFDYISNDHGLSGSMVHCILQDRKGFLWFGTDDGLNRYDGYTFKIYRHDPQNPKSLGYNEVTALYEDRAGVLWIGTEGGGLNRFDRELEQFTRYVFDPQDPQSLSHNQVDAIVEDHSGALWIGTRGGGLNRFDRDSEKFLRYQFVPDDPQSLGDNVVTSIHADRAGKLWIGTKAGLDVFHQDTGQFTHSVSESANPSSLCDGSVEVLYEDDSGKLWIGTRNGLSVYDPVSQRFTSYHHDPSDPESLSHNTILAIYEDQTGTVWIGTEGGGLNLFDRETQRFTRYLADIADPYGLHSNFIASIYEDRSGLLWFGTYGAGVQKFNRRSQAFVHYARQPDNPNSLSQNTVYALYQDHANILWIGTYGGGLNKFDRTTGKYTHYQFDPDNPASLSYDFIWAVFEDSFGNLWIGTEGGGLNRFDRKTEQFKHYTYDPTNPTSLSHDAVSLIFEDRDRTLWVGTLGGGLNKFDRATEQFTAYAPDPANPHSLSTYSVMSMYEDRSGVLWIGTFGGGLNRFDRETEQFTHYRYEPNSLNCLSNNFIWSIHEDQTGTLWIGTSGGLNKLVLSEVEGFDPKQPVFAHYRQKDGLPNDVVYGILEDENGYLWMSTGKGLSRFDPQTATFKNYDEQDGLQSDYFNPMAYYQNRDGELFFGGINGFNLFSPSQLTENPYIPQIVLTDFQIFNQSAPPGAMYVRSERKHGELVETEKRSPLQKAITETTELGLYYKDSVFSFEFAALDFTSPEKNVYAYMLEGFDEDWVYSGTRRSVRYTNLPSGDYVFRVKGANNDGVWNEEGSSLQLTIIPPIWGTLWFQILVRVLIVLFAILLYLKRTKKIKFQKKMLEVKVNERTKELRDNLQWLEQEISERKEAEHALKQSMERLEEEIIERKHAERALKESEEYNRLIIETMNEGLAVVDTSYLITYVNTKACEMFGYTRDELLNRSISDLLDEANLNKMGEILLSRKEYLRKGQRFTPYELEWRRSDGNKFPTIVSPQPLFDDEGNFRGTIAVLTDIAERKQMEQKLHDAKAFTESILNNVPEVIYSVDSNFQLQYVSPKCEQVIGYTPEEFIDVCDSYVDNVYPDDRPAFLEYHNALFEGEMASVEFRLLKKDGTTMWVREAAKPTLDAAGNIARIDASLYDITELKEAEKALAEERNLLRTLIDTIPDVIYSKDVTGRYISVNKAFVQIFNKVSEQDLLGKTAFDIMSESDANAITAMENAVIQSGQPILSKEVFFSDIVGKEFWMLKSTVPLRNESGDIVGVLGINRDITEHKRTERETSYLAAIIEATEDKALIKDLDFKIIAANRAYLRAIGKNWEDVVGKTEAEAVGALFADDVLERWLETDRKAQKLKQGEVITEEFSYLLHGTTRTALIKTFPVFDKNGAKIAIAEISTDITQLKRAEERLRKSERRFRDIAENMSDLIWETDQYGVFMYCSEKVKDVLGYTLEEVIGRSPLDFMLPEERERVSPLFQEFTTAKRPFRFLENWSLTKDGRKVCFLTSGSPVLNEYGELVGYRGVNTDVTEQKQAEDALRESEEKYRMLFENLQDVFYRADMEGNIILASPSCQRVFGYLSEDAMRLNLAKDLYVDAKQQKEFTKLMRKQGFVNGFELQLKRKDGTVIWGSVTSQFYRDHEGNICGVEGLVRDITDRKQAERETAYLAAIIEGTEDMANIRNLDGRVIAANSAFLKAVGKELEDVIGKTAEEIFAEIFDAETIEAWKEFEQHSQRLKQGEVIAREDAVMLSDGRTRATITRAFPVFDKGGKLIARATITTDISELKQKEAELIDANVELKETLKSLKRTQAELIQAEKMAALGQLIAGVAHEINTPLGAIRASIGNISKALDETTHALPQLFQRLSLTQQTEFLSFLDRALQGKRHLTSREERRFRQALTKELEAHDLAAADEFADTLVDMGIYTDIVSFVPLLQDQNNKMILKTAYNLSMQHANSENILTAVERASKVVFALKNYAHFDYSGQKVQANIKEGLECVLTLYHNQLKHGVEVVKHYGEVPAMLCYPDELNQVWTNLIHNAIHAMQGTGTLEITLQQTCEVSETSQVSYIVVQFTDSGCGIPDDIKDRIFEPFFTTKPAGEGSGLGLDIVQKIVEKHQGKIEVESQPGKTTFTVWLPVQNTPTE